MRNFKLLIIFFFLSTIITIAQQKKYVSYEVKRGETLKSIAKIYNLSTKDLSRLNPGVSKKPVLGTVIIVPNKNYGKKTAPVLKETTKGYFVQPKETIFGISKKFGISMDELKAANPILEEDGLKIGMELNIPRPTIARPIDSLNFVMHTVVKDDTFFNLTRRFEVTEEDLRKLNPPLSEGLKLGLLLKIKPIDHDLIEEQLKMQDSIVVFNEQLNFDKTINLAVILPYQLNKLNDSIVDKNFEKSNSILNIATDFHLGAAMAIDSLKRKGLKINVSYFDSENSNQKLQRLISANNSFNSTDLIIGPLFFDKAHWVATRTSAKVVAPLYSNKQDALNSNNLIKSAPNSIAHREKLLSHLEKTYDGENILVINDGEEKSKSQLWQTVNRIKTFDSIQTISVLKPEDGYIDRTKFEKKLDSTTKNWVILISDDNTTTSSTINNLKGFAEKIDIKLFALNKGENFNNSNNSFLGKLNFTYPSSEFIDVDNAIVSSFYEAYRRKNRAYPSKYAIRGFDVTYDALVRLASSEDFSDGLKDGQSTRVFSVFKFEENLFGSFENTGLFLIQYNEDLTTTIFE